MLYSSFFLQHPVMVMAQTCHMLCSICRLFWFMLHNCRIRKYWMEYGRDLRLNSIPWIHIHGGCESAGCHSWTVPIFLLRCHCLLKNILNLWCLDYMTGGMIDSHECNCRNAGKRSLSSSTKISSFCSATRSGIRFSPERTSIEEIRKSVNWTHQNHPSSKNNNLPLPNLW